MQRRQKTRVRRLNRQQEWNAMIVEGRRINERIFIDSERLAAQMDSLINLITGRKAA